MKEEFSKIKLYIKPQVVQAAEVRVTGWLMYFTYLKSLEQLFYLSIKYIIKGEPMFVLTRKTIFDRVAQS